MNKLNRLIGVGSMLLAVPHAALAESNLVIEEITITAERREASLQDTGMSVSAVSGEKADLLGASNINSLANWVPNVSIGTVAGNTIVTTRGVSSTDITALGDPATPFHIDGVYIPRVRSMGASFFDIERIEYLRGPQGTLYGRNATAGGINIITRKPTDEFGGWVDFQLGDYNERIVRGAVNVPITDTVKARFAGYSNKRDGYNDSGSVADYDDADEHSLRAHLLAEPTTKLSILLSASYTEVDRVGGGGTPAALTHDPRDVPLNTEGTFRQEIWTAGVEVNWDLGPVTLTSITAYRDDDLKEKFLDFDRTAANSSYNFWPSKSESFNQEIRLSSNEELVGWNWLVGLYYFEEEQEDDNNFLWNRFPNPMANSFPSLYSEPEVESKAVFANLTRDLNDELELTLGARYTKDEKSTERTISNRLQFPNGMVIPLPTTHESNSEDFSQGDWKVGLNWTPGENSLYYLTIGTGYKAGGFNSDGRKVDPETVIAYEVGSKNQFFDRRLQLNTALFYQQYEDMHRSIPETDANGNVSSITRNAGEATIWGAEIEGIYLATESLQFDFTLAYLNSEFDDYLGGFQSPPVLGPVIVVDLAGNELAGTAPWSLNIAAQYEWDLGDSGNVMARLSVHWEDESWLNDRNRKALDQQDSFTMSDATIRWSSASGMVSVDAFVRNIEDEDVKRLQYELPVAGIMYEYMPPRTFGAKVTYRW